MMPIVVTGLIGCLFGLAHKYYRRKAIKKQISDETLRNSSQKKPDDEINNFYSES